VDAEQGLYSIDELADLGGVSRRTVRYYVQLGLLPAPQGVGRGRHYGRAHLDRLLEVKAWQEIGLSLDEIRARSGAPAGAGRVAPRPSQPLPRTTWRRLTLAPGVELHVAQDIRLPAPGRLEELAEWCRARFTGDGVEPGRSNTEGEG
jgi:DNA-binding transcriptional MerR regulator